MPVRVQLKRTKGWRIPPGTVKVDRSTRWGNPFRIGEPQLRGDKRLVMDASEAVSRYRALGPPDGIEVLRGRNLACWCRPGEPCHGDVLLEWANS